MVDMMLVCLLCISFKYLKDNTILRSLLRSFMKEPTVQYAAEKQ